MFRGRMPPLRKRTAVGVRLVVLWALRVPSNRFLYSLVFVGLGDCKNRWRVVRLVVIQARATIPRHKFYNSPVGVVIVWGKRIWFPDEPISVFDTAPPYG